METNARGYTEYTRVIYQIRREIPNTHIVVNRLIKSIFIYDFSDQNQYQNQYSLIRRFTAGYLDLARQPVRAGI